MSRVGRAVQQLVCLVRGHRQLRTITGIQWDGSSAFGAYGRITGSRLHCERCGRQLGAEAA